MQKDKFFCPFCDEVKPFKDFGNPPRKNVQCEECKSLERHRFLFYIYNFLFLGAENKIKLLHLAPEYSLYKLITKNKNIEYVSADLSPERFNFTNCKKENFCDMTFKDKQFDVILLNQVMEHIEDEQRCLLEIKRCLKDDGIVIINIPYKVGLVETLEDANIKSEKDREKYYGQSDHVRLYGEDAGRRFEKAGFLVFRISEKAFDKKTINRSNMLSINSDGINPGGYFWLRKAVENS
ncbi:MAG TPA: class I SAM-dependent methyltransferase [Candidatus Moranbacteria bacterium]|nr:class I SAM-dependent methyltransferase [Candidatus Moranbacteria bacterium]